MDICCTKKMLCFVGMFDYKSQYITIQSRMTLITAAWGFSSLLIPDIIIGSIATGTEN